MADATPTAPAVAPAAPAPGTPAYDAAMAAKVEAANANAAAAASNAAPAPAVAPAARPEHIPEKFWNAEKGEVNVEAMAKSYTELEKKATPAAAPAAPKAPTPGATATLPTDADNAAAAKAVADAGLDMTALQAEFMEKGDISPETRATLAAKGIPAPMIDGYIAGQKALAADYDTSVKQAAGGEEGYGKLVDWAKTGLSNDEKIAFNKAVTSGDKAQAALAVSGLKARMGTALGNPPAAPVGGNAAPAGDVYESMKQVTTDMAKPEYKNDPAFRAKVYAKLDRSNFGTISTQSMA